MSRLRPKTTSPTRAPLYSRPGPKNKLADVERKENTYIGAKPEELKKLAPTRSSRPTDLAVSVYPPIKKTDKFSLRMRCSVENEAKPKTLAAKRRSVLAIRKPNAGKARNLSASKSKTKRIEEPVANSTVSARGNKTTGSFSSRSFRKERTDNQYRVAPSSSSSEEVAAGGWDAPGSATPSKRRPFPPPLNLTAPRLKKIRLKSSS